jgi:nitroreductase
MEIQSSGLISIIKTNKNIRKFGFKKIRPEFIRQILECASFAPSSNEPWKVNIVSHPTVKAMLSEAANDLSDVFETANSIIVIFLDLERSTDRIKDILAMGAFIDNILLAIHAVPEMGAFWLEDILNKKEKINEIFKLNPKKFELMGVIAIGAIDETINQNKYTQQRTRRTVEEFADWF